ncbi:TPA: ParA family protein [Klebsiella michiganensis]
MKNINESREVNRKKQVLFKNKNGNVILTIAVQAPKGGSGKSTTSLQLASYFSVEYKKKVIVVDKDEQGTSITFYNTYKNSENGVPFTVVTELTKELIGDAEVIIWDYKPTWDQDVPAMAVVIPFVPAPESIAPTIKQVNASYEAGKKVLMFANMVEMEHSRTATQKKVLAIMDKNNAPYVIKRQAYPTCYMLGTTLYDESTSLPYIDKARNEFKQVIIELFKLFDGGRESDYFNTNIVDEVKENFGNQIAFSVDN